MGNKTVRVNLHCHSTLSDGVLAPEDLARQLAEDGVVFASLTDHDTCEGSVRFRQALSRWDVGCIDGVEITAQSALREVHLLAYGIDPGDRALGEALAAERSRSDQGVRGLVDSVKRVGGRAPRPGALAAAEAIRLAHEAGGAVFLAHPLSYGMADADLEALIDQLAAAGMDGIEAVYGPYPAAGRRQLERLAQARGLAVSGGSDMHDTAIEGQAEGVELEAGQWRALRGLILDKGRRGARGRARASAGPPAEARPSARRVRAALRRDRPGRFALRIVAPTVLAMALFVVSIFALIIPRFEAILLERKKEMIRELTNSVVSILAEYAGEAASGRTSSEKARADAAARVRDIRYGRESKDYFWITDMRPVMIVHPYRQDLVGADVGGYADANGVHVFVEFVNAVREKQEGYVEYLWQWEDDAQRIVPKLSFVKRFAPWDWVVGTGIYLDDVRAEIDAMVRRLIGLSIGIGVALALLLAFVAQQSLAIERRRTAAEAGLRDSHERYRALVEASTEGMVMVSGGVCTYANATFLDMLGLSEAEIALHTLADLVAADGLAEADVRGFLEAVSRTGAALPAPGAPAPAVPQPCECALVGRDGKTIDCLLAASRFAVSGRRGWIVTAKDLGARRRAQAGGAEPAEPWSALAARTGRGLIRAAWSRRAQVLQASPAAREILGIGAEADVRQSSLFSLLGVTDDAARLYEELSERRAVTDRRFTVGRSDGDVREVSLSAAVTGGEPGSTHLEAMIEDITARVRVERQRDDLLAELETSSLSLNEPVATLARPAASCPMNAPARAAAERMGSLAADALLVTAPSGEVLGIVTGRDIRERVVAKGLDSSVPVREIMSAPLVSIPDSALISEALLLMRGRDIGHLAVRGPSGAVSGILRAKDMLQLHRQSIAVLQAEIAEAAGPGGVGACWSRLPEIVRSLSAGGARPASVVRMVSAVSDMALQKLVRLAVEELGSPPADFAFLLLGSGGREELTLGSDQDSAILHEGPPGEPYFTRMGELVCGWLADMGIPRCRGGFMAENPEWCAPRAEWERRFAGWIALPDAEQLRDFNIFFDFRAAAGSPALALDLRRSITGMLPSHPEFFLFLAREALAKKLPPAFSGGVFRDFLRTGPTSLDLKEAIAPVVRFARLYALKNGVQATGTVARLAALRDAGVLKPAHVDEITRAWWFLAGLRLRCQEEAIRARGEPSDSLDTRSLAPGDEAVLRAAASQVVLLQKRISFDFLGSAL
jgi:PAS domain S-box-containing protein